MLEKKHIQKVFDSGAACVIIAVFVAINQPHQQHTQAPRQNYVDTVSDITFVHDTMYLIHKVPR